MNNLQEELRVALLQQTDQKTLDAALTSAIKHRLIEVVSFINTATDELLHYRQELILTHVTEFKNELCNMIEKYDKIIHKERSL